MDFLELFRWGIIPIAIAVTGYQFKWMLDTSARIKALEREALTLEEVRQLIADKLEVLHLADRECVSRVERLEAYITRIDLKLDKITDILSEGK